MDIYNGGSLSNISLLMFRQRNEVYYDNLAMLDIEVTTAFLINDELAPFDATKPADFWEEYTPYSLLYLWNVCIDGQLFCGRTLDDLLDFLTALDEMLEGTFYIYIHNASYEFQFMRNILDDITVFARKKRKPLKFNWRNIEFRCSYMLTRLSLDAWAREKKLPVQKLVGMYEYSKLRTPYTPLTLLERDYGYNDVLVGVAGLEEYRERYKHVKDIPITQTSCIRKEVNKALQNDFKARKRVAAMTDISFDTYSFLVDCFTGGYTHANVIYADRVIENLWDFDISSSYPWVMLSEKFPLTPFIKSTNPYRYMEHPETYAYAIRVEFRGVKCRYFNTYISASKCEEKEGLLLDNGRIIEAERIVISILDVDYDIIKRAYKIEETKILDFYYCLKGYLSNDLRRYIAQLYSHKTTLKGNEELFTLYFKSKEEINGIYGMGVTKDITDEILFDIDWKKDELTIEKYYEKVEKKMRNIRRLNVSYAQGIYVPAYGRKNLWHMVHLFDDIITYMDTDSIKTLQFDEVLEEIDRYNGFVNETQKRIAEELKIDYSILNPTDFKGKVHSIGTYERDKDICKFKTLGAKRYLCQYDESLGLDYLKMTVSGVRKKAVEQLNSIDDFSDGLVFDIENAGKLMLIYNDEQPPLIWNRGKEDEYLSNAKYGISGYNIPYHMTVSPDYLSLILELRDENTSIFRRKVHEKK